jgi:hypothetical protein
MKRTAHPASFRDPAGFVFVEKGIYYRSVSKNYLPEYERLMSSGLYEALTQEGLLIRHQEVKGSEKFGETLKILRPTQIPFISYPYEWTFSQLKDAALATLEIQRQAMKYKMSLKDATPYNIQFVEGKPCLIDTLSFEVWDETKPWVPYKQFCEQFLAPLALAAYGHPNILSLQQSMMDGIPLEFAAVYLPLRARLKFGLLIHLILHAKAQKRSPQAQGTVPRTGKISAESFWGLIESLKQTVSALHEKKRAGRWGTYYQDCIGDEEYLLQKKEFVRRAVQTVHPTTAWDVGANTGYFSRYLAEQGVFTISMDGDISCVEENYRLCKEENCQAVLPFVMDICHPSPALGWQNRERASLIERGPADLVIAFALIHHLAIAKNIPFEKIASFFALCGTWLIIEFVPKDDPNVQTMLSMRKDIFPDYKEESFKKVFSKYFTIKDINSLQGSRRVLYLMKKKKVPTT